MSNDDINLTNEELIQEDIKQINKTMKLMKVTYVVLLLTIIANVYKILLIIGAI